MSAEWQEIQQTLTDPNGWLLHPNLLGEGSYGRVFLLVNESTGHQLACKIISNEKFIENQSFIKKEVTIQRSLKHENILRFVGDYKCGGKVFLLLEFAARGELYQLVEPGVGMDTELAQIYMRQLMCAVDFLHKKGIVHRDIKPENILIHANGILKLSDFGLATISRSKGKERILQTKCGTRSYMAPEIYCSRYRGGPADIWSCGITLIVMLAGELPWRDPAAPEYLRYVKNSYMQHSPWFRIGNTTLSLLRKMLDVVPTKRPTASQVLQHPWLKFNFEQSEYPRLEMATNDIQSICSEAELPALLWQFSSVMNLIFHKARLPKHRGQWGDTDFKKPVENVFKKPAIVYITNVFSCPNTGNQLAEVVTNPMKHLHSLLEAETRCPVDNSPVMLSQPIISSEAVGNDTVVNRNAFTQPSYLDNLLITAPLKFVEAPLTKDNFNLINRMTRFFVVTDYNETVSRLRKVISSYHYNWQADSCGAITISTLDSGKSWLIFKCNILQMDGKHLVDFRLFKGCGLEFKRRFVKIRAHLADIIAE